MLAESRKTTRQEIYLEEIIGSFYLDIGKEHFEKTVVNDVSVSGAGIQLSQPIGVGKNVDLTFTAGDWKISVQGKIIWCSLVSDELRQRESYRMGVKFNPRNEKNNVIFFMASRSIVNPQASDPN